MKKLRLLFLLCALLVVFFAGCTDDSKRLSFSSEKAFRLDHEIPSSVQGAASFGKYYFQFSDYMCNVGVYDLETGKLLYARALPFNLLYHCNNANFGKKIAEEDEFPLLYVSMENIDVHCALVFRVERTEYNEFSFTQVQTIVYPDPRTSGVYYPNCMIDGQNDLIYVIGYTQNSYQKADDNNLRVTAYRLPSPDTETAELKTEDAVDSFELESVTATQGGLIRDGKIYQVYGFDGSSSFRIIDLAEKNFTATVYLSRQGFKSEPESLVYFDGTFYCTDVTGVSFRFSIAE